MFNGQLTRNHLQPDKPQRPRVLRQRCGTVTPDACDTPMFERVRRDERLGLIRSAQAAARLLVAVAPGYGVAACPARSCGWALSRSSSAASTQWPIIRQA
jgi:hypothetical protein